MGKLNIKIIKFLSNVPLLLLIGAPLYAGNLSARGVSVLDMAGSPRATFSNTERIVLRQAVHNQTASKNKVIFKFTIYDPSQSAVFKHEGNAAPGSVGQSQTQVAGIPISQFYRNPGAYRLVAAAALDGETVTQETSFTVSSPNVILTYPPNGATNLADKPLIFRWVASGASKYRVTVGDDIAFYNSVFSRENNGENYLAYPQVVSDPRQNLVAEKIYYWKVEGLDSSGNKVAESGTPFNFSVKSQAASQTKNLAVVSLAISGNPNLDGPIPFKVIVKNQGSRNENNISVRFGLGGIPAGDSPRRVPGLGSGAQKEMAFTAFIPQDQEESLAVACIDTFDDNVADNCKSKLISRRARGRGRPGKPLTQEELWEILRKLLGRELDTVLEGYSFDGIVCENCQGDELGDLIDSLLTGDSQIVWSNIPQLGPAEPVPIVARAGAPSAIFPGAPEAPAIPLPERETLKEWSGRTASFPGKKARTFVIRKTDEWKKFWSKLTSERTPRVDFKKFMAVGIIAGTVDRAADARILQAQPEALTFVVRYYVIEAPAKRVLKDQAYRLKLVEHTKKDVEFKKLNP